MNNFWTNAVTTIGEFLSSLPFTGATWFVLAILAFFVWLFVKAHSTPNSPVQWEHLIIDSNNDRTSPYKLGYLIGLIVATWIILTLTDKEKLSFDILGLYLTYLLGGAGINSFVKRGETNNDEYEYRNKPTEGAYHRRDRRHNNQPDVSEGPTEYGPSVRELDEN